MTAKATNHADPSPDRFETQARAALAAEAPDVDLDVFETRFLLIRLASRLTRDLENTVHRPAGWSYAGFRVMFTVWAAGDLAPNEISRFSGLSRAAVSSVLNTLERDQLVTRTRESEDRRLVTIRLTASGRERLVEAYGLDNQRCAELLGGLSGSEMNDLAGLCRIALATPRPDHPTESRS